MWVKLMNFFLATNVNFTFGEKGFQVPYIISEPRHERTCLCYNANNQVRLTLQLCVLTLLLRSHAGKWSAFLAR